MTKKVIIKQRYRAFYLLLYYNREGTFYNKAVVSK